ncbi:AAA family ATPase, partial [Yoonia sp.]|uniref:ATP-dependent nuclease n=1 Tax=Yoonia sp. TaxID=2212373 RepID=UPI0025EC29D7
QGAAVMKNQANKTKIENALDGNDSVIFRRDSSNSKKRVMIINGVEVIPGTGFDPALNDFLPKFEYVNTKQYYDSVAKYSKSTPIGIMLSGVLEAILQGNQQYIEFHEKFTALFESEESAIRTEFDNIGNQVKIYLEQQFPDCTKVKFEVTAPVFDELLKNFDTTVNDGIETLAEEKGDGMQRALMLAIIQAYADFRKQNNDEGKTFLFFIDEAELHLHPTAQRNLKDVLHKLSVNNDQVFINTHSSVFVADNYQGQTIFKVEKNEGETIISFTDDLDKPAIVFDLLGGSPADLLLPQNFFIVEGQSEWEFFTRVIRRFYPSMPKIQIVKATGDIDQAERTINAIEKLFIPLNMSIYREKVVLLIDMPSVQTEGGVNQFKQNYKDLVKNDQLFNLEVRDLEQYYPDQIDPTYNNWRKTQAELDAVNKTGNKTFTGKKKIQLSKHIGDNISRNQFEVDMNICFKALQRCWKLSY